MGTYTAEERKKYATLPGGRYPIGDVGHAKAALSRINQGGLSREQKLKVIAKAHAMLSSKK